MRKYSFTNRVVGIWNSLPNNVVKAKIVRQFEIGLEKNWEHQDVKYYFKADININC